MAFEALRHDLALVDPDLDANAAVRGLGLGEAVIDVSAQRLERHAALRVLLRAAHLAATEAATALDADALGAGAHSGLHRALHRAAEGHAILQLLRDGLRHQARVQLGALDLVDVDLHGTAGDRVDLLAEGVDLDTGLADDDARTGGVDVDRDLLRVLADMNIRQACMAQLVVDVLPDLDVLTQVAGELAIGAPVRLPVVNDADAEAARMNFLAHV